jgi:hypothetical protein
MHSKVFLNAQVDLVKKIIVKTLSTSISRTVREKYKNYFLLIIDSLKDGDRKEY